MRKGMSFDVGAVLGIGIPDASPLPDADEGEVVLRVSPGLSLFALRHTRTTESQLSLQYWYIGYRWAQAEFHKGVYRMRLGVPQSEERAFPEQRQLLLPREAPTPVVLVVTALLCLNACGLRETTWFRCAEANGSQRITVTYETGKIFLDSVSENIRSPKIVLAAHSVIT